MPNSNDEEEEILLPLISRIAGQHLNTIAALFKPGVEITLLVRRPGKPTQDFMLTSEGPDAADKLIAMIERRFAAGDQ